MIKTNSGWEQLGSFRVVLNELITQLQMQRTSLSDAKQLSLFLDHEKAWFQADRDFHNRGFWQQEAVEKGIETAIQVDRLCLQFTNLQWKLDLAIDNKQEVLRKQTLIEKDLAALFASESLLHLVEIFADSSFGQLNSSLSSNLVSIWLTTSEGEPSGLDVTSRAGRHAKKDELTSLCATQLKQQHENTEMDLQWRHPDIKRGAKLPRSWIS
jgi:hypothetical protein